MTYRIGFIGTGDPDGEGFAMAYRHASGYQRLDDCEIVACADIVAENATAFAAEHDIQGRHIYQDYEAMLKSATPDVVSVCVPPGAHADIVTDVAESGVPAAVHCEKPMALTWGEARRMAAVCAAEGVQLTINHQLRFGKPYREAKRLLEEGTIGDLVRVEFQEQTLYDNGTHSFDLVNYFNDQCPVEWVLGQVDYTEENTLFGAHNENQAVVQWRYENGVYGLASTGRGRRTPTWRSVSSAPTASSRSTTTADSPTARTAVRGSPSTPARTADISRNRGRSGGGRKSWRGKYRTAWPTASASRRTRNAPSKT